MTKDKKQALGLGAGGLGLLVLYRMHKQKTGGGGTTVQPVATQGQVTPYTPQAPLTLQPGESVYDPNTTGLTNTPTAITAGGPLVTPIEAPAIIPQATSPGQPGYVVNVNYPPHVSATPRHHKPTKRKPRPHKPVKKTTKPKTKAHT